MRSRLVKEAIESRGLSVRQFAQSIGIPASTLQSAVEQADGIEKMRFGSVVTICEALNLDLKTFQPIRESAVCSVFPEDEMSVLEMYRVSDAKIQEAVRSILEVCVEDDNSTKKGA